MNNQFVEKNKELILVKMVWKKLKKELSDQLLEFNRNGYDKEADACFVLGIKQKTFLEFLINNGWETVTKGIFKIEQEGISKVTLKLYQHPVYFIQKQDKVELVVAMYAHIARYECKDLTTPYRSEVEILEDLAGVTEGDYKTYKVSTEEA